MALVSILYRLQREMTFHFISGIKSQAKICCLSFFFYLLLTMEYLHKFLLNPDFKVEKFDNEILLYAVSNTSGVYLNETAYLVWEMCSQGQSVEEIVLLLEETYSHQKETIREDVTVAITSLVDYGALIPSSDE